MEAVVGTDVAWMDLLPKVGNMQSKEFQENALRAMKSMEKGVGSRREAATIVKALIKCYHKMLLDHITKETTW